MAANGNEKITFKQGQAIDALVMLGTVKKAAAATGIAERTIYRWKDDPDFTAALRAAERAARDDFSRSLFAAKDQALGALLAGLDARQKINVRLSAARLFFDAYFKFNDWADLEERLAELEQQFAN